MKEEKSPDGWTQEMVEEAALRALLFKDIGPGHGNTVGYHCREVLTAHGLSPLPGYYGAPFWRATVDEYRRITRQPPIELDPLNIDDTNHDP